MMSKQARTLEFPWHLSLWVSWATCRFLSMHHVQKWVEKIRVVESAQGFVSLKDWLEKVSLPSGEDNFK
jgi:hypothetical protein